MATICCEDLGSLINAAHVLLRDGNGIEVMPLLLEILNATFRIQSSSAAVRISSKLLLHRLKVAPKVVNMSPCLFRVQPIWDNLGMISLTNHDSSEGDQWGRYNLPRYYDEFTQKSIVWMDFEAQGTLFSLEESLEVGLPTKTFTFHWPRVAKYFGQCSGFLHKIPTGMWQTWAHAS